MTNKFKLTTNILSEDEVKEVMSETLKFLSSTLSKSLGPYGSTTIIQDRFLNHQISKDGYSILKKIYIEEEEARTILDLVMKISRTLVRRVGDGSTSSIIIAESLYREIENIKITYNIPSKDLLDILNLIAEIVAEKITNTTTLVDDELSQLKYIASVSTNNDDNLGELIRDLFKQVGKYGFVNIETSKTSKTYFDNTRGFEVNRGYINKLMINHKDGKTVELDNTFVFMCDGILDDEDLPMVADLIGTVTGSLGKPIVLIAKGYSGSFETFMHMNLLNNKELPLLAIDISTQTKKSYTRFEDLAINLGCRPYLKGNLERIEGVFPIDRLGLCDRVTSNEQVTRFIGGNGDQEEISNRVYQIEQDILEKTRTESMIDMDEDLFQLRKRLACLQNNMATLYVGGVTENEKETSKFLIEDAVFACKSALEHGYTIGGNLIIPIILKEHKTEILNKLLHVHGDDEGNISLMSDILDSLYRAFEHSFTTVLMNAFNDREKVSNIVTECVDNKQIFNLKTMKIENINETCIINSIETDIEILKSAISIIGLLSTSNQFVKMNTKKN